MLPPQAVQEAEIEEAKKAIARKNEVLDNKTFLLAQMDVNYNEKVRVRSGGFAWTSIATRKSG